MRSIKRSFRFTLWPTLFTVPAVLVMIGLGFWQVERMVWKNALIESRNAALVAAPVPAPDTLEAAKPLDFHRVRVAGVFEHDKELYIGAYDARGFSGFQIVTPLRLEDGRHLLINRGWVPFDNKDPKTREEGQTTGTVTVTGILRLDAPPTGWIIPKNRPGSNFWFYVNIAAMAETKAVDQVMPYFIEADIAATPARFPIGGQTRIALPNDHLQYAITWFLTALTLLVIYFIYHYRKPGSEESNR